MIASDLVLTALAVPDLMAASYLMALSCASQRLPETERTPPHVRFDIVVPAHDERQGIAATVASLRAMDYPRDLFRVVVVADNCTDDTAERARLAGAEVLVREDREKRGKGYALEYAFERILAEGRAHAVVVVDADTVVSPNLLRVFGSLVSAGAQAIQAEYRSRNPDASWRTRLMSIALGSVHTLRSRARERLRVSCGLHGNGMCFTSALLRKVPYDAFSITEDLEYSIRLAEKGHRVVYAAEARVLGEMPTGERASRTQRERWEGGRSELARLHAPRLLMRALRDRDSIALDRAIDLLLPPLSTIVVTIAVGIVACAMLSLRAGVITGASWLWIASGVMVLGYAARGWQLSGTGSRGLGALLHVPFYLAWKLTLPLRRREHARGEWVRTARERGAP